jgi:hypothetical protein
MIRSRRLRQLWVPIVASAFGGALAGCPEPTVPTDAMDATLAAPPPEVLQIAAPVTSCDSFTVSFDVRGPSNGDLAAHIGGLGASAFTFTLTDPVHDTTSMVTSSCPIEAAADAAFPGYQACFSGLMPASPYFLRVTAALPMGTTDTVFFVMTSACADGGTDGSTMDVVDVVDASIEAAVDATMDSTTPDASDTAVDAADVGDDSIGDAAASDASAD